MDGSKSEGGAWKAFKLFAAYKHGYPHRRKFFDTILNDKKELKMWKRFLQSKNRRIAREALWLAKRYGVLDSEVKFRN